MSEAIERVGPVNPLTLLQSGLEKGMSVEQMGKLVEMAEHYQNNLAIERYGQAMADFQKECPQITKTRIVYNKGGQTERYRFAAYEDVMKVVGPILARNGISVSFTVPTTESQFRITMRIQVGSYFVDKEYSAPMLDIAKMAASTFTNEAQAFGIALSYHKRYCLCAGLNIVVTDEDDDAEGIYRVITKEQLVVVENLIKSINDAKIPFDEKGFKKYIFGAWLPGQEPELKSMPAEKYDLAVVELGRKLEGKK